MLILQQVSDADRPGAAVQPGAAQLPTVISWTRPGGGPQPNIFSVAKYETANGAPNFYDVVFAFANLDRNNYQQGNFNVNITQNGANLFGIKSSRVYNVKNIAAYTAWIRNRRNTFVIPRQYYGTNLLNGRFVVSLNKCPPQTPAGRPRRSRRSI